MLTGIADRKDSIILTSLTVPAAFFSADLTGNIIYDASGHGILFFPGVSHSSRFALHACSSLLFITREFCQHAGKVADRSATNHTLLSTGTVCCPF